MEKSYGSLFMEKCRKQTGDSCTIYLNKLERDSIIKLDSAVLARVNSFHFMEEDFNYGFLEESGHSGILSGTESG